MMSNGISPSGDIEAVDPTLSPCVGCGAWVTADCRCQVCQRSLHCFCSAVPGQGHGDHYICHICHAVKECLPPTGTGQGTPEASQDQAAAASKKRRAGAANPPKSTSRKSKVQSRLSVKKRVKTTRSQLFHILESPDQRACLAPEAPNNRLYYGTILGGNSQKGWDVQYDILPAGQQVVNKVRKDRRTIVELGEEEPELDPRELFESDEHESGEDCSPEEQETSGRKKKETPIQKCTREFCSQSTETLKNAKVFVMQWGKGKSEKIEWKIHADTEYVEIGDLAIPSSSDIPGLDMLLNRSMADNFFKCVFPDITGHASKIDKYHSSPRSSMFVSVQNEKIKFCSETGNDPDEKVKLCYLLLIAGATELESGVDNLWKNGPTEGRKQRPNFSKYISVNEFKAFKNAAPWAFVHEELWYTDKRDTTWDVFLPMLQGMNEKRASLFGKVLLLMLDESMVGWRPKTTKTGGLPNITFEPRKPVDLGSMLKNGAEAFSGIMVVNDMVQLPEQQRRKKFVGDVSSLPDGSEITQSTAEVLRQCETGNVAEGGWIGADAWFGSVMSCIELMTRFNAHSTFIVKNNTHLFPKKPLLSVMVARFDKRPAGHWAVFSTTIAGIEILVMAYAWSQKGISLFVSTCGKTCPAATQYESCFEDEFGCRSSKMLNRPHLADFLYVYLPLLDEHNKQRQATLALERAWPTRNCWFRLLTSIAGFCLVDLFYLYRAKDPKKYQEMDVLKFADFVCGSLKIYERGVSRTTRAEIKAIDELVSLSAPKTGNEKKTLSDKQKDRGRSTGGSAQGSCWICLKYQKDYVFTSFMCRHCNTPMCMKDRRGGDGNERRTMTCIEEHLKGGHTLLLCSGVRKGSFPESQRSWT